MKCKGENCNATDGVSHSKECFAEHERTVIHDMLDTSGNRNPEFRHAGYTGRPLKQGATVDQARAYEEGVRAREPNLFSDMEAALEAIVSWCNTDEYMGNHDTVVRAESVLKRLRDARLANAANSGNVR